MKRELKSSAKLSVRPLQSQDIPSIANYWLEASDDDLTRMGCDTKKVRTLKSFEENLAEILNTPLEKAKTDYSIWCVDGKAVGFSSLKNIKYKESGDMHLHIWDSSLRGKGYGPVLFCLSAVTFYHQYQLKKIICEPKSSNPLPNRMLQKIGFPLVKTYEGASSELSAVCELNQYDIQPKIAEEYLMNAE